MTNSTNSPPRVRRIFPDTADDADFVAHYVDERIAPAGRPWTIVGMITTIDGASALGGTSGRLGNATDRLALQTVRSIADIIVVGAQTARAERYRPPSKPNQKIAVATNSGDVAVDTDLFPSGRGLVLAPNHASLPSGVDCIRAGVDHLDLAAALGKLRSTLGVRCATVEGGPRLNAALVAADLVDELCITIAPIVAGGTSSRIVSHAPEVDRRFRMHHLLVDDEGYQFQRWLRTDAT